MRRKVSVVIGVCAALVLAGAAGAVVRQQSGDDDRRPVGGWREGVSPTVARTPVALTETQQEPAGKTAGATTPAQEGIVENHAEPVKRKQHVEESATTAAAGKGRQKVGTLIKVSKLLGYAGRPRRESFSYPGASYVKLHFSRMAMMPGDYVTVSDAKGTESHRYDAPKLLAGRPAGRWAMSITGDTAVLQLHRGSNPPGARSALDDGLGIHVDKVARGLSRTEQTKAPEESLTVPGRTGREESVCDTDTSKNAICYKSKDPVAYTRSKAVARLLIDGTELCTGWRIGPNNRMLTNNHCFTSTESAGETEIWFNYQCTTCGGYDTVKPIKVWGKEVVSTNKTYDYTLFSVQNFSSVQKFRYLSLDTQRPVKGQALYVPQHPAGDPTRIAGALGEKAGNCDVQNNAYTGYASESDVSYYCDTEGGSSGSPVLSRKTNRVVALHHFGGCPNSGVRGDLLYAKLKSLL